MDGMRPSSANVFAARPLAISDRPARRGQAWPLGLNLTCGSAWKRQAARSIGDEGTRYPTRGVGASRRQATVQSTLLAMTTSSTCSPIFSLSAHATMLFLLCEAYIHVRKHPPLCQSHVREAAHQQGVGYWSRAHSIPIKCFVLLPFVSCFSRQ